MKKINVLIIIGLAAFALTACNPMESMNKAVDPTNTTEISIEIPKGASTTKIAAVLKENDLINNETAFKMLSKNMEADGNMKAGTYVLSQSMSSEDIINKLTSGDVYVETFKFTIPEGFNNKQIIERLVAEGFIDEEKFNDELKSGTFDYKFMESVDRQYNLEGFLFPDTYELKTGASEHEIIDIMLKRFDNVFKEEYYSRLDEIDMDINELISLAAIIEKEAVLDTERDVVSSVFHNRLNKGMKLESCATVQYVLDEVKDVLTFDDIAIETPYNTYKYAGLTPAPIASPGEKSIIAALFPAQTDYLFFVVSNLGDGSQYFSKTFAEHQKAIQKSKENKK